MRKGSIMRVFGWSVVSVAATGFVAAGALAEPPTNLLTRPPRVDVQRPHSPHNQHKPHPALRTPLTDHPPQVVLNIHPSPSTVVSHTHTNMHVVPITHAPVPRKTHTINIVQIDHIKMIKKH
jgi:hypothetical protein